MFIKDLMYFVGATFFMGFCLMMIVVPTRKQKLGWVNSQEAYHATGKVEVWRVMFAAAIIIWLITAWLWIQQIASV